MRAWRCAKAARLRGPALFAQALLARHGHGINRVPRFNLLLAPRAMPRPLALHRHVTSITNTLAVNLQTVLHRQETAPERLAPVEAARQLPAMTLPARVSAPAVAATEQPTPPATASVFRRMLARGTRTETRPVTIDAVLRATPVSPGVVPGRSQAPSVIAPDDVPMLRPHRTATVATASQDGAMADAPPSSPRATPAAPVKLLPPHEIERIADQVLGSIDRRIIAERERHGRF